MAKLPVTGNPTIKGLDSPEANLTFKYNPDLEAAMKILTTTGHKHNPSLKTASIVFKQSSAPKRSDYTPGIVANANQTLPLNNYRTIAIKSPLPAKNSIQIATPKLTPLFNTSGSPQKALESSVKFKQDNLHGYTPVITPISLVIFGLPVSTLAAASICGIMYLTAIIVLASINCETTIAKIYILTFNSIATVAVVAMTLLNVFASKYRFDCTTLAVSLVYSGSAALIFFGLVYMPIEGLCYESTRKEGIFRTKFIGNFVVWTLDIIGLPFQIVAHFYFG